MGPKKKTRVIVLFGGRSAEHDVSRVTASHVLAAMDPERYDIVPVGIERNGRWVLAEEAVAALRRGPEALPPALTAAGPAIEPLPTVTGVDDPAAADGGAETTVVLPLLHGPFGEDGTVQGMLELAGVPYAGAGVLGSALAMDKAKAKEVIAHAGIPQADHLSFRADQPPSLVAEQVLARFGLPVFVKPANLGSSIGVSKARTETELMEAIELALSFDEWLVVEEAVEGREIELGVLGNLEPEVSVPGEIVPAADFYDYEDKYHDGAAQCLVPAELTEAQTTELQELARRVYLVLRCEGMARVDFFLEEGGRGPLLNEVNTIPGFTPISMFPKLWEASGVSYPALIDRLIDLAVERHERRTKRIRTSRP